MAVITSYALSNGDTGYYSHSGYGLSQTFMFTGNDAYQVTSLQVKLSKFGSPSGNMYVQIHNTTGTYGTDSKYTGSALATSSTIAYSSITDVYSTFTNTYTFNFTGGNSIALQPNQAYALYMVFPNGNGSNAVFAQGDGTGTYGGDFGGENPDTGGTWTNFSGQDLVFVLNGNVLPATLVPSNSTIGVTTLDPMLDEPGDPGYTIFGGWGSSVYGISYAGAGPNISTPTIGVIDVTLGMSSTSPTLTEDVTLTVANATIGTSSTSPALAITHNLVVDDATIAVNADNAYVDATVSVAIGDDATIGISSESPSLIQQHNLTVDDATIGSSSSSLDLPQQHFIIGNPAFIGIDTSTSTLIEDYKMLVDSASIAVTSPNAIVYLDYNSGTIETGIYTPQAETSPRELVGVAPVAIEEYTPQAVTSRAWEEGTGPDLGSWN